MISHNFVVLDRATAVAVREILAGVCLASPHDRPSFSNKLSCPPVRAVPLCHFTNMDRTIYSPDTPVSWSCEHNTLGQQLASDRIDTDLCSALISVPPPPQPNKTPCALTCAFLSHLRCSDICAQSLHDHIAQEQQRDSKATKIPQLLSAIVALRIPLVYFQAYLLHNSTDLRDTSLPPPVSLLCSYAISEPPFCSSLLFPVPSGRLYRKSLR